MTYTLVNVISVEKLTTVAIPSISHRIYHTSGRVASMSICLGLTWFPGHDTSDLDSPCKTATRGSDYLQEYLLYLLGHLLCSWVDYKRWRKGLLIFSMIVCLSLVWGIENRRTVDQIILGLEGQHPSFTSLEFHPLHMRQFPSVMREAHT